jgi:hypothetical protein
MFTHHGKDYKNFYSHKTKENHKAIHFPIILVGASDRLAIAKSFLQVSDIIAFLALELVEARSLLTYVLNLSNSHKNDKSHKKGKHLLKGQK